MAVDDFGTETLKKSAEETTPGDAADYYHKNGLIPQPQRFIRYFGKTFQASGSSNLAIDGSTVPVNFDIVVPAGEVWFLRRCNVYVAESGALSSDKFANGPVLANGLDFRCSINGNFSPIDFLLQNNADLATNFFGNINVNTFIGTTEFFKETTLTGDTGDFLRIVVQDDVTAALFLQFTSMFWIQV